MNTNDRSGKKIRSTKETNVEAEFGIDGTGRCEVETGIGFLDHMLSLLAKHGRFDIRVKAEGDLEVDAHHTTEDVGIVLGDAFKEALGNKAGIYRFADVSVPMQDSLASVALDICGRPHLTWEVKFPTEKIGEFDAGLIEEFFHAFAVHAGITIHIDGVRGTNSHHIAEAVFKAMAQALRKGTERDPGAGDDIPSTKGTL